MTNREETHRLIETPSGQRGVFVTLEGADGVGKTTQAAFLRRAVQQAGHEAVALREPGGTSVGERVRELLLDPTIPDMDPTCELLLYEAARAQLVAEVVRPALERGAVVVSDRFFDSTSAYQGYGRGLERRDVQLANELACGGLLPDRTLVLDMDARKALGRAVTNGADRMELAGSDFEERVRSGFLRIAQENPERMRIIDADGTPEQVWDRIRDALADLLDLPKTPPEACDEHR